MNKASYPKLHDIQTAHRKLMQEYIGAVDKTSRLPFFVNCTRILLPFEQETFFERSNRQLAIVFTLVTWRPFILLLVELHMKSKLNELMVVYRKYGLQLPDGKRYLRQRNWLKTAIAECAELSSTLSTWKNMQTVSATALPVVFGWIASFFGAEGLSQLMQKLGFQFVGSSLFSIYLSLYLVVPLIFFPTSILILLINLAFVGKRAILLPVFATRRIILPIYNIYVTENILFDLTGHKKTPELAIDNITYSVFIGLVLSLIFLIINLDGLSGWVVIMSIPIVAIAGMLIKYTPHRWD